MRKAAAPVAKQLVLERERLQRVLSGEFIPLPTSSISDLSVITVPSGIFTTQKICASKPVPRKSCALPGKDGLRASHCPCN